MTAKTGRTVNKHFKFQIDDVNGTLRDVPVSSIGGIGLAYDETDLTAFQDAIKGVLLGHPDFSTTISGPWSTDAAVTASGSGAAAALSGSHTVLEPLNGGNTPLAFGFYFGVQHAWETGEYCFGITGTAANGCLISSFTLNDDGTYTATIKMAAGSAAPDWDTNAFT